MATLNFESYVSVVASTRSINEYILVDVYLHYHAQGPKTRPQHSTLLESDCEGAASNSASDDRDARRRARCFRCDFFLFLAAASFRSIVVAMHAAAIPSLPAWCCFARSAVPTTEVAAACGRLFVGLFAAVLSLCFRIPGCCPIEEKRRKEVNK